MFYAHVAISRRTLDEHFFSFDGTLTHPLWRERGQYFHSNNEWDVDEIQSSVLRQVRIIDVVPLPSPLSSTLAFLSLVLASHPNLHTICGAPTFSILAHALTNHSALISTLIFSVTPAASPSTRRHNTAPISRPGGTKEPPRQSLGHCQPHRAYARYARSKLHTRGTYPSMREAAHTVSGSRF